MTARPAAESAMMEPNVGDRLGITRFHIAAIATQRARQLQMGARPRIPDAAGHKATRVALAEVLANAVSWHLEDAPVPRPV